MDGAKEVKILTSQTLKPAREPVHLAQSSRLQLSGYDRIMRYSLYQRRILFYKPVGELGFTDIVSSLKVSLAEALVSFYPLAGRLLVQTSSTPVKMELDCSNLSVQFSEAVTEASMDELKNANFEPSEFCDKLCEMGCSPVWPWSPNLPLLFVQVTRFSCGGISVGIAFSHQVCDGVSAWHFFKSWAEVAMKGSMSNPPVVTYSFKEIDMDFDRSVELAASVGFRAKKKDGHVAPVMSAEKLPVQLFKLDKEAIAKLKSLTQQNSSNNSFSTYEVLCAYFWKQTTIARCLSEDQEAHFFVLINSRDRFGGMPKFYFGNAISTLVVTTRVGDLIHRDIGYAASLLHQEIASFNEEKNQGHINFLEKIMEKGFISELDIDPSGFSLVVSSPRHPIFECDFGWGKPIGVTFGMNDLHAGKLYLFPSAENVGGVDVTVVLKPEALERLTVDF